MTDPLDSDGPARPPRNRVAELRAMTARLAGGGTGPSERSLLLAGAVLVPLGVLLIIGGYWGAAHAPRVIQQIPYEISGGILGLAFVFDIYCDHEP